jgi:8-oxo-dGTP pyrophosphatase MutT (NUDIX family)
MIKFITAAGGLVQNSFGEYLLIFRHGKWDLPKGGQNKGETLLQTAIREVCEECGLNAIIPGPVIATTWHSYYVETDCNPSLHLTFKQTHWYKMYVEGRPTLHPQTDEGIEQCIWCTPVEASQRIIESYPSIQWLFRRATGRKM